MADIEQLVAARRWKQAEPRLYQELVNAPTDHWLWYTLSLVHYEQKDYETAYRCARRAVELESDCPWALWHLAGSAYMTDREDAAAAIWLLILNHDFDRIAGDDCGEGPEAAMRLLNDVHYRLGRYYQWRNQRDLARQSFGKYLHNVEHGVASTYSAKDARKFLGELEKAASA
jgi:tetratricopeptide (TPR) repeat protein